MTDFIPALPFTPQLPGIPTLPGFPSLPTGTSIPGVGIPSFPLIPALPSLPNIPGLGSVTGGGANPLASITSFFSPASTSGAPMPSTANQAPGYQASNFSLLSGSTLTGLAVASAALLGLSQVKSTPTYSASKPQNLGLLNTLGSKVSTVAQLQGIVTSTLTMTGLSNFLPANTISMISNLSAAGQSNMFNGLSIARQATTPALLQAVLGDITLNFGTKQVSLSQIANMYTNFSAQLKMPGVKNDSIKTLLGSVIPQFLPTPLLSIFNDVEFIANIDSVLGANSPAGLALQNLLGTAATNMSQSQIADLVPAVYATSPALTMDDPFGVQLQQQFKQDLSQPFITQITQIITDNTVGADQTAVQALLDSVIAQINNNFNDAFNGNVGVPPLTDSLQAIVSESHNMVQETVVAAFEKFANDILLPYLGIKSPALASGSLPANLVGQVAVNPFDHLLNVKRNLQSHIDLQSTGGTTEQFLAIESFLGGVLLVQNPTAADIVALNNYIDSVMNNSPQVQG